jgi:hypothetical protein
MENGERRLDPVEFVKVARIVRADLSTLLAVALREKRG